MFFENSGLVVELLDVVKVTQGRVRVYNTARDFHALSYRFQAKTTIQMGEDYYPLTNDSVCYFPRGRAYTRISDGDDLIAIHFRIHPEMTFPLSQFSVASPSDLSEKFREIYHIFRKKKAGYHYRATQLFYAILESCHLHVTKPTRVSSPIRLSVDYLMSHYTDPSLTIPHLASKSYMSEVYFRKLFKASYGTSPAKYLASLRMAHAIHLLSTGYYTLTEIASLSGYRDYKYFLTTFKRHTGKTPTEYLAHLSLSDSAPADAAPPFPLI